MKDLIKKIKKIYPQYQLQEKWTSLIFWAIAIFILSNQPNLFGGSLSMPDFILRKIAHAFEFGVLALLIFRVIKIYIKNSLKLSLYWTFILSLTYAISDEFHQTFVLGRQGRLSDVLIDLIGIIIVIWLLYSMNKPILINQKLKISAKGGSASGGKYNILIIYENFNYWCQGNVRF